MSSGHPPVSDGKQARLVYAEGFGPETYLGGDDFAETIPLDSIKKVIAAKPNAIQFQVRLTDTEMEISCI
jgi:hypothetical protein